MNLSNQIGADGQDEDELTRLRRRVVADGYSSAHSCQHCDEIVIVPYDAWSGIDREEWRSTVSERLVVATKEEVRQRTAAGCKLWSMVSDEARYEILKNKRDHFAAGNPGSVALSDEEAQALEELSNRCLSQVTIRPSARPSTAGTEACVDYVQLEFNHTLNIRGSAQMILFIDAYENGLEYSININLTVFGLPGGPQLNDRYALVWPPNVDPGSAQSFELMRTWIRKCALEHGCGITDQCPSSMPTMLLSVDQVDKCGSVRLVEMKNEKKQQYLALSYCWGHRQKKMLTTCTLDEFCRDGIQLEDLDATIQDAIRVTMNLGYLYLWIDALCLVQDDAERRNSEIGRMDSIYENASITIVAARASSVSEGFLTQRQPAGAATPDQVFKVAYKHSEEQQNAERDWVLLVPRQKEVLQFPHEPWESRAWTLQEDLLSRRQLRFGKWQTSWVCNCSQKIYEDFDGWYRADLEHARSIGRKDKQMGRLGRILRQPDDWAGSVEPARNYWYDLVETYSRRTLSFQEDRLPAVSAVARRMARILRDEYWCGIWKSNAPWELLWSFYPSMAGATCTQEGDDDGRRGPSWSWASQKSGVWFLLGSMLSERYRLRVDVNFEIIEHVAEHKSPEHIYGAVTAAQLRVRGLIMSAPFGLQECHYMSLHSAGSWTVVEDRAKLFGEGPKGRLRRILLTRSIVFLDSSTLNLLADPRCDLISKQVFLLLVGYNTWEKAAFLGGPGGLVLLNEGGNEFSRLGTFSLCRLVGDPDSGEGLTGDEQTEFFLQVWGGQSSVKEIVLI